MDEVLTIMGSRSSGYRFSIAAWAAAMIFGVGFGGLRPAAADTLRITFNTSSPGPSNYEPHNVHVVWVEDNTGGFVITIGRWAQNQRDELAQWRASHTDWQTDTDGVSGATQSNYNPTYTLLWDMKDRNGQQVPDGVYTIRHELTNDNRAANSFNRTSYTVNKNGVSDTQFIASSSGFSNITIEYTAIPTVAPQIDNLPPSLLMGTTARLNGDLISDGGENSTVRIYWGNNDGGTNPGGWDNVVDVGSLATGPFFTDVSGLNEGTTYYYRCYAENSAGSAWAPATMSFVAADLFQVVFQEGDNWKYFKGWTNPGAAWNDLGYDDTTAGWLTGPTGIGYGDGDDATVLNDMQNNYDVVYMRKAFTVVDPANVARMTFTVDYDDGFVVFINGKEADRRSINASTGVVTSHEAGTPEVIDLTDDIAKLFAGNNVIAIQGRNVSLGSSDFSMIPELTMELLTAEIQTPDIHLNPAQLDYGTLAAGAQSDLTFDIENAGDAVLQVNSIAVLGLSQEAYGLVSPPAVPFDVAAAGRRTITVRFAPAGVQTYGHALVAVGSTDPDEKVTTVSLSGEGTGPGAKMSTVAGSVGGDSRVVALSGSHAFVGQGASLTILDVSNPANPTFVGRARLSDVIGGVAVVGEMAYAAVGASGLIPIDVSSLSAPVVQAALDTPGHAHDVAAAGSSLCVADGAGGMLVYTLSISGSPSLRSLVPTNGPARAVAMSGGTAYLLDEELGIQIYDVTNPAAPSLLGALNEIELGLALEVAGNTAYATDRLGGFFVADVANPAAPSLSGQAQLAEKGHGLSVSGPTVYVAMGYSGLQIINVTNPASPALAAVHDTPGEAHAVALSGSAAMVADGSAGFRVIDVANPAATAELGAYILHSAPAGVAANGSKAFAAEGVAGFQVVNLSPPSAPQRMSFLDTLGDAHRVVIAGSLAYIANGPAGFQIVDVTDPAAPLLRGAVATAGFAQGVAVSGSTALVADGAGVYLIDAGNPDSPVLRDTWNAEGYAGGVAIDGSYGYVAEGGFGLRILNLSVPTNVTAVGFYDTPGVAYGVVVSNGVAYVADGLAGLQIVDVSNPASPGPIAAHDTPGIAVNLALSGSTVYLVDGLLGLKVVDVSDPFSPALKAESGVPVNGWSAGVSGALILVADNSGGLVILGEPASAARRWLYY